MLRPSRRSWTRPAFETLGSLASRRQALGARCSSIIRTQRPLIKGAAGTSPTSRTGRCSYSSNPAARGRSNRCAETAPLPRSRSPTLRSSSSSRASARRSATGMLASTRKRKRRPSRREHRPGRVSSSPMSTRSSQRAAMVLADGQVISTPFSDSPRLRVLRRPQLPSTRRLHGVGARRT
jgi:hypothetical protein